MTPDELRRCIETLEAIERDRSLLAEIPPEARAALSRAAGRVSKPTRLETLRLSRELRARERDQERARDRQARSETAIRRARLSPVFVAADPPAPEEPSAQGPELGRPRACYVCKEPYRRVHFFYDSMCDGCGDFNYAKRRQTARLEGRVALVTGARIKIGYQAALMLLRAGAAVVATTRFPRDAAARYAREADFPAWRDRLHVHGLDLRHAPSVEIFCRFLDSTLDRLDFLVNNAAQTVRRPPPFYTHLLQAEEAPFSALPAELRGPLRAHEDCKAAIASRAALPAPKADATGLAAWHSGGRGAGIVASARLSQLKYSYADAELGRDLFPAGRLDADLQQVDLRSKNSWRLRLAEVSSAEMLELLLINAAAPFILCAKLKPLLLRGPGGGRHVVNVSAMEGSFSRGTKTDKHPHTNMAKAALNMLTLTSAPDYAKDGIHMNAVDTGWVTDEDPAVHADRKYKELDFQPPLDIVDGAARVCDPIFSGHRSGEHVWGKFLKDYKPVAW